MRLIKLKIYKIINNEIIREIKFNEFGLSLICDEENYENNYESGSSIGKTTFIKCIDICLGASSTKSIYKSASIGENTSLKAYILDNKISLQLTLKTNRNKEILLERHLFDKKEFINGIEYNNYQQYAEDLKKIIFPGAPKELTFRSIMPKFIRITNEDLFKYLGAYGQNRTYHDVYYYFLDLYINPNEGSLIEKKGILEKKNKQLEIKYDIKNIEEFFELKKNRESNVESKKQEVIHNDYIAQYSNQDSKNSELIYNLDDLTEKMYNAEYRIQVLEKNIGKERKQLQVLDEKILQQLYSDFKAIFGNPIKSYLDFVKFHNDMCMAREKEYSNEIYDLKQKVEIYKNEINKIRKQFDESFISYKIAVNESSNSLFEQYYNIKTEFTLLDADYREYQKNTDRLRRIEKELEENEENKKVNTNNKEIFNKIFSDKSNKYLGAKYNITFNDAITEMPMSIEDIGGALGTGDNKALISAFDFAFYDYFVKKNMDMPYFVIHDRMENVSIVELGKIFNDVRETGVQYILPILYDRINSLDIKEDEIILRLSKKNKLFKF